MPDTVHIDQRLRDFVAGLPNKEAAADYYAECIGASTRVPIDWPQVNHALLERWSKRGLMDIKKAAWVQVTGASR